MSRNSFCFIIPSIVEISISLEQTAVEIQMLLRAKKKSFSDTGALS